MNILVCGYGNIGHHIEEEFKSKNNLIIFDKYKEEYSNEELLKDYYDAAFVAVPTEMREDGSVNTDEIFDIVPKINAKVIIIRSAIPVGTCDKLALKNVVVAPECYGTTQHSLDMPDFAVFGSNYQETIDDAVEVYQTVKNAAFKFCFVDWKTAELSKYMENCWLALKVTFCNEFASIAEKYGISYNNLRAAWLMDTRVNPSHTFVYKDKPYFDSHCFNKDIPGLIKQAEAVGADTPLIKECYKIKLNRQSNKK